jgi:hypothetical protein
MTAEPSAIITFRNPTAAKPCAARARRQAMQAGWGFGAATKVGRAQAVILSGAFGLFGAFAVFGGGLGSGAAWAADDFQVGDTCPKTPPKTPALERGDVYKTVPFKAGESATFEVTWSGIKAGYGTMEVRAPRKYKDVWHRVFHVEASTGDWFSTVFVAKEEMEALSRPWDFGISKFFMEQNEGKLFSKAFRQKKWLEFNHDKCKVEEKVKQPDKDEESKTFDLAYGAGDALGVIFELRSRQFSLGKKERALVYTSEKNWWLEADPVAMEKVTVPAGTFDTVKLKLQTFIGKDLQQKGDVYAWIATGTPERQLVQIQGEIKIGSVWIKLHKYSPGS